MRIRVAVPDGLTEEEEASVIDHALETTAAAAQPLVASGRVPTAADAIESGRVRWRPEAPGDEHFDPPHLVLPRGHGDCDDLASWHAASLRATGEDPHAFPRVYKSGKDTWHAIVERSDGSIDDPSRWAGMGRKVVGIGPSALWRPMFLHRDGTPAVGLAVHPWYGGHVARVDAPWFQGEGEVPVAYSTLFRSRSRRRAVVGALGACMGVLDAPDPLTRLRLAALRELLCGTPTRVVGDMLEREGLDREEVGSLFGDILPAAGGLMGGPLGSLAGGAAAKLLGGGGGGGGGAAPGPGGAVAPGQFPQGTGGAPGTVMNVPGGPIIVRF